MTSESQDHRQRLDAFLSRWRDRIFDERFSDKDGKFFFNGAEVPSRNGILRFTSDSSYSTGNFGRMRDAHAKLQLDSVNGLTASRDTILSRTKWPPEFFKDKLILECGCGAGPDSEVLIALGANLVSVDIAGVDVAQENVGAGARNMFVQASILDLPFRKQSFDIVYCHRVLMHTPDPPAALRHILQFVKPDGAVFVHSYARNLRQMLNWKYALRPITKRMDSERLYNLISWYAPPLYRFTSAIARIKPEWLGRALFKLARRTLPVRNSRFKTKFKSQSEEYLTEYAIHNTFDALSPPYDSPVSARQMRRIAEPVLRRPFEIAEHAEITLLRTVLPENAQKQMSGSSGA